jgi:hypothetical protein
MCGDDLIVTLGCLSVDKLLDLLKVSFTLLFAQQVMPKGMVEAPGAVPGAALRGGDIGQKGIEPGLAIEGERGLTMLGVFEPSSEQLLDLRPLCVNEAAEWLYRP